MPGTLARYLRRSNIKGEQKRPNQTRGARNSEETQTVQGAEGKAVNVLRQRSKYGFAEMRTLLKQQQKKQGKLEKLKICQPMFFIRVEKKFSDIFSRQQEVIDK